MPCTSATSAAASGRTGVDCSALDKVRRDVAKTLGTSIPYYALIRMDQFQPLIDRIGGIKMNIRGTLIDYHYSRNYRKIWVPKENGYQMNGGGDCGKKPKKCRNALATPAAATARRAAPPTPTSGASVASRRSCSTPSGESSPGATARTSCTCCSAVKGRIYSNLPKTASGALALYAAAKGARFAAERRQGLRSHAMGLVHGQVHLPAQAADVRQWVDNHFKP